ncbi:hypothetical protein MSAN_00678700 [Mycena sanguinolenta]|uniref:RING-type domain-containing protein n=1 Tax=Mycena sanguinolenta TaxID=230812 RepID=A0A8H6Z3V9_9AGAR|nr:hypothetical protein MSAN_00678700 [Mycena sanguinolenta]
MSEFNCHICLSNYLLDKFRVLTCGHCFCTSCLANIQRTNAVCPDCRAPISGGAPKQIRLEPAAPLARVVAEGIGRMDADAKLVSVRTAQRKLRQVAKEMQEREEATAELLAALADFSDRIVPLFMKARSQATEIGALKKQLEGMDELRAQAERTMTLSGEVSILREEQRTLREETRDAKARCESERVRAATIETQVRRAETAEKEGQTEIRRLKGLLERAAEDRNVQRNKMKAAIKERDALRQQLEQLRSEMQGASSMYSDDLQIENEMSLDQENSEPSSSHDAWGSESSPSLAFEGLPRPGFQSDWELGRGIKRKERPGGALFPIALNSRGRTMTTVQLGPKHSRRVKARV